MLLKISAPGGTIKPDTTSILCLIPVLYGKKNLCYVYVISVYRVDEKEKDTASNRCKSI